MPISSNLSISCSLSVTEKDISALWAPSLKVVSSMYILSFNSLLIFFFLYVIKLFLKLIFFYVLPGKIYITTAFYYTLDKIRKRFYLENFIFCNIFNLTAA